MVVSNAMPVSLVPSSSVWPPTRATISERLGPRFAVSRTWTSRGILAFFFAKNHAAPPSAAMTSTGKNQLEVLLVE